MKDVSAQDSRNGTVSISVKSTHLQLKMPAHTASLHFAPYPEHGLNVVCATCRRRIRTGRGVPIHLQLRSHRLFSENFEEFAHLVDCATLYHTGAFPPGERHAYSLKKHGFADPDCCTTTKLSASSHAMFIFLACLSSKGWWHNTLPCGMAGVHRGHTQAQRAHW